VERPPAEAGGGASAKTRAEYIYDLYSALVCLAETKLCKGGGWGKKDTERATLGEETFGSANRQGKAKHEEKPEAPKQQPQTPSEIVKRNSQIFLKSILPNDNQQNLIIRTDRQKE
jgi:hypothetical protein